MAKFVIECPHCGNYAEASTGFLGIGKTRTVNCSCGRSFSVEANKMSSKECPHCGNNVVYDQSKGEKAICPVCHEKINTRDSLATFEEFSCPSCGCKHHADKNAEKFTCPLCETVIDVQQQIAKEKAKNQGLASIIKYEGDNSTFIWKHPIEDFNYGSQLIVHESQEAIFFKDGKALDLFGAGRYTLESQNMPVLESLYKLPFSGGEVFHCEVYFINQTVQMSIKWGTDSKVRYIDPDTGLPLEVGACGEMNIKVSNSRKLLLKLVGTTNGIAWGDENSKFTKSLQMSFRPLISTMVKSNLTAAIKEKNIHLLEVDEHLAELSEILREKIVPGFEEYGLTIPQFYLTNILLPENDPNFKRVRELHTITLQKRMIDAEKELRVAKAKAEADVVAASRDIEMEKQTTQTEVAKREAERSIIDAQAEAQRTILEAQAEAQRIRNEGLAEADVMKAKGYTEKDVLQANVQMAYAEGLGNFGSNAGGGSGSGGSMASDMVGMMAGMKMAGVMMGQMDTAMNGISPTLQPTVPTEAVPEKKEIKCPKCGESVPENSKFCLSCGEKIELVPDGMVICPECGKTVNKGKFCLECGHKFVTVCPKCGNELPDNAKFCLECGEKIQ